MGAIMSLNLQETQTSRFPAHRLRSVTIIDPRQVLAQTVGLAIFASTTRGYCVRESDSSRPHPAMKPEELAVLLASAVHMQMGAIMSLNLQETQK